ncbi:hypothetical protein AB0G74_12625 [Streptomyces sp. NPDC020875]|uniref:hypothetical protein n=1 Tax=Streptomyces sp. NPDC020875 TaxID=3154898 RepID=UPI00340C7801
MTQRTEADQSRRRTLHDAAAGLLTSPEPPPAIPPPLGTLLHDTARDRAGEFRRATSDRWTLRPVGGGPSWSVLPEHTEPADTFARLRAREFETARREHRR